MKCLLYVSGLYGLALYHTTILDWSKLKAFADDKIDVTQKLKFHLGKVENIVGKGENAGYQHFLKTLWEKEKMLVTSIFSFFHKVFQKASVLFHR